MFYKLYYGVDSVVLDAPPVHPAPDAAARPARPEGLEKGTLLHVLWRFTTYKEDQSPTVVQLRGVYSTFDRLCSAVPLPMFQHELSLMQTSFKDRREKCGVVAAPKDGFASLLLAWRRMDQPSEDAARELEDEDDQERLLWARLGHQLHLDNSLCRV